eukprot:TRINITY_DN13524_c0_g1_i1.p1 TRINITY_DN13524_c0_g1~~TRINITY_DN13524_c0_g1_i1.p1  ORF type:complete len:426 (+),score=35.75 TRINITY_DN13524_c0_g1_i1:80-1357(+)
MSVTVIGQAKDSIEMFDVGDSGESSTSEPKPVAWLQQQLALLTLSLGIFSVLSIWFAASAVVKPLRATWDISDAQASFLTSTVNMGFVVGCMTNAILNTADLIDSRKLICMGAIGAAAANATLLCGISFYLALLARFLVGLFLSFVYPPSVKLLSSWFAAEERGYAVGVMFTFFSLGVALPQLLVYLSLAQSWQPIVVGTSVSACISGMLVLTVVRQGPYAFPKGSFDLRQCRAVVQNPSVVLPIVAYCGHQWEAVCVQAWIATFFERIWGMPDSAVPLLSFSVLAIEGLGTFVGGVLGDRFGRVQTAGFALTTSGLSLLAMSLLADDGPIFVRVALSLLWGFTSLLDSPNYSALVSTNADQKYVGTAVNVQLMCGYLVAVIALWIAPTLAVYISWRWSFAFLAIGPSVGVTALMILRRKEYKGK